MRTPSPTRTSLPVRPWRYAYCAVAALALGLHVNAAGQQQPTPSPTPQTTPTAAAETIVFFRHGEKPPNGLGQLTCRGLNRALALPPVLLAKFGRPDYLFAPNPAVKVRDGTLEGYDYIRPLATIEPTAIFLGMPVNTDFGYDAIGPLAHELTQPRYAGKLIFVAWEHLKLEVVVKDLLRTFGGNPKEVPSWPGGDYDSLYVLRLEQRAAAPQAITFTHDHEGLEDLSDDCPEPKRAPPH